jgi:hypothetical protein
LAKGSLRAVCRKLPFGQGQFKGSLQETALVTKGSLRAVCKKLLNNLTCLKYLKQLNNLTQL